MTANSQLLTTKPKTKTNSKQLEQEQNHRNGDHVGGYQQGGRVGRMGEKVQEIRSPTGRNKIERGRLKIA